MKRIVSILSIFGLLAGFASAGITMENTKFCGKLVLTGESIVIKSATKTETRDRSRFALWYKMVTQVEANLKVGVQINSFGGSARSANVDYDDNFTPKYIGITQAYVEYTPIEEVKLLGGKFLHKDAIFVTDDLLWDGDIAFEGVSACLKKDVSGLNIFLNLASLDLIENDDSSKDAKLHIIQPGFSGKIGDVKYKTGVAYYNFIHVKDEMPMGDWNGNGNTLNPAVYPHKAYPSYKYDYDSINPNIQIKINSITLLGEAITNFDSKETGYLAGGSYKLNKYKFCYNYRYLPADAWLSIYPDASAYEGKTNVAGSEIIVEYNLTDAVCLGLDYYNMFTIGKDKDKQEVFQLTVGVKF